MGMSERPWYLQVWHKGDIEQVGHFADYGHYPTFEEAQRKSDSFVSSCRILKVASCKTYWRESSGAHAGRLSMSVTNRIGSSCWYQPAVGKDWCAGVMHAWSTDCDWGDEGPPGLFPVAVIEDVETGKCSSVYVTRVCFSAIPPSE